MAGCSHFSNFLAQNDKMKESMSLLFVIFIFIPVCMLSELID